ncbi:hypothetical protein B0H11DRAFT_2247786 [Mycena galericulata]|nr:hypothetical protein B0H11DRAFT_2247786 [Mycena galericulata]
MAIMVAGSVDAESSAAAAAGGLCSHYHYEETDFFPSVDKAAGKKGLMDGAAHKHGSSCSSENQIDILAIATAAGKKTVILNFAFNIMAVFMLNMDTVDIEDGMWHEIFPPLKGPAKRIVNSVITPM